jgi:hypothetical protein
MIVTLNGNPLDYTLEQERTIGEVLSGIESWLEQARFSLSAVILDGTEIPAEKIEEIGTLDIGEIELLDLIATSWNDLVIKAFLECDRLLGECALERKNARDSGRIAETASIAEAFVSSAAAGILSGSAQDLHRTAIAAMKGISADPDADLASVRSELGERVAERANPLEELKRIGTNAPSLAQRLEALPLELQTGKDVQAAVTLRDFASFIAKLLRIFPVLESEGVDLDSKRIGEYGFKAFFEELNTALKELTAGYENGDAILVGDLAEYEIAPRLRMLDGALAELGTK